MTYSSNSLKSKIFALFFATVVLSAYAGEGNFNYYGQRGIHKTQSAQTLGHGRIGLGLHLEGGGLSSLIKDHTFYKQANPNQYIENSNSYIIDDYFGGNIYPFLSLGLSNYFDFSFSMPVAYLEYLKMKYYNEEAKIYYYEDCGAIGWGDFFISTKLRIPFDENFPFDLAGLAGLGINTGRKGDVNAPNGYGPWFRDPMFVRIEGRTFDTLQYPYSNSNPFYKFGLAATFDVGRTKVNIPIMLHINGTYRGALGTDGNDFSTIPSFSTALEWTPFKFISGFFEYYRDFPLKLKNPFGDIVNLSTMSFGGAFHLGQSVDLQLGVQVFTGDKEEFIDTLKVVFGDRSKAAYKARLIPNYLIFGGLVGKIYTAEPEKPKEEKKEFRNPDTDEDGICDPWVAETGRQSEFSRVCKGIDLCPYEAGTRENKGCPLQEAEAPPQVPAPTIIFTAMPDVIQKGGSVTLTWQVNNATTVSIEGIGDVPTTGTRKMKPTENTVYKLTAVGEGGTQTATADVEIAAGPLPVILFTASSESVQVGHVVTLKWQVTNATKVSIEGIGDVQLKGSKQLKPTENTTYTLTAVGEGGTQTETISVEVTPVPIIEARVNLQGVTFGSGNATLTANAKKILDGVAEQLLANPKVKIEIQGHTDNVGNPKSNQDLSERRAKAVVGYLATKGVKMTRMKAVGYGQDVPISDNNTADGRELNRRIEMIRVDD
ncbi:MAG: OmpA family protein [Fibromonadaceae bacterium]|jgi:outer membrane protein OmpA-like peptidoglycan-associated protein|nr:OmpA family protein [Fibromonadaceae bacterium]